MTTADSTSEQALLEQEAAGALGAEGHGRAEVADAALDIRELFDEHYGSIWRLLRRLGVREEQLDDACQEVFWVAARRLNAIRASSAHAFLYGVALRVASDVRRRRKAQPLASGWEGVESLLTGQANPEECLEQRHAREVLDLVLDCLPLELRTVFVLFEIEGLAIKDIAEVESLPQGTVSSRLRRAREEFATASQRVRAALTKRGVR